MAEQGRKGWKEALRKEREQEEAYSSAKLVDGENVIRLLPDPRGSNYPPYLDFLQHKNVGPDDKMAICGKDVYDPDRGECWLCDQIPKLLASKNAQLRERAGKLKPSRQTIFAIALLSSDGRYTGPFVWFASTGGRRALASKVKGLLLSDRRQYEHPQKGYNFVLRKSGSGMRTSYEGPETDEESTPITKELFQALQPLDEVAPQYDEKFQRELYTGKSRESEPSPKPEQSSSEEYYQEAEPEAESGEDYYEEPEGSEPVAGEESAAGEPDAAANAWGFDADTPAVEHGVAEGVADSGDGGFAWDEGEGSPESEAVDTRPESDYIEPEAPRTPAPTQRRRVPARDVSPSSKPAPARGSPKTEPPSAPRRTVKKAVKKAVRRPASKKK